MQDVMITIQGNLKAIGPETTVSELISLENDIKRYIWDYEEDEGFDIHGGFRYAVFAEDLWGFFDILDKWKARFDEVSMEGLICWGGSRQRIADMAQCTLEMKRGNDREGFDRTWDEIIKLIREENR